MTNKKCFRCAQRGVDTPAFLVCLWSSGVGYHARGEEPWLCRPCDDEITAMTDDERNAVFADTLKTDGPGDGAGLIAHSLARSAELKKEYP